MRKAMRHLMFTLLVAALGGASGFAQSGWEDWQQISHDPYTDPAAEHATEVEPLMVAHGDTIVASIQVGRFLAAGSDNTGWATSQDGGKSWKHGFLTGLTTLAGGTWPAVSVPTIAYDEKHHSYLIASMPFDSNGTGRGVLVNRSYVQTTCKVSAGFISSGDGGKSWNPAEKVAGPMLETTLAPTYAGDMVANYNSAVFVDGKPHGAFALTCPRQLKTGQYDEAIYSGELAEDQ